MNGVMDSSKLHRALQTVDRAGKSKDVSQHLQDQILRIDGTEQSADRHHKKTEPDVHALFTRGHIEPHLEHVVGHQDEKHTDRCHQNPGPPHILPVGNRPDRILPQLIEPFHISSSPYILESF